MSSTLSKKYLFFFVYVHAQGARAANVCSSEEDKKEDATAPSTFTLLFYCLQLRQYHHNN